MRKGIQCALLAAGALIGGCDRTRPYVAPVSEPTGQVIMPATPLAAAPGGPVLTADGWRFTFTAPQAQSVHLAGSFNEWSTSADPLVKGAGGVWEIVKPLPGGSHQYKFVVNGTEWKEDPANPNAADDGYGGKNSLVEAGGAPPAGGAPAAAAAPIAAGAVAVAAGGPQVTPEGWKFTYADPAARTVHLAGTFNDWSSGADPLVVTSEGVWEIVKPLPPGTHHYKFVVNGVQWKTDPANPQSVDDGYGGENSVLVVP